MSKTDPTPKTADQDAERTRTAASNKSETRRDALIILATVAGLALWGGSVLLWGVPGLYIPALALVPVIWVLLLMISRG